MADKDKKDVNVEIVRLASDGTGVGYIEGKTVFVPGMLPGEKGKIHINEVKKNYLKAEVLKIETFAEDRQHPPCTSYSECGGCSLQHLKYRSTLAWKKQWVEDSLQRIGGLAKVKVDEVIGMENPWRYRNKAVLHKGLNGKFGYYQEKSNNVVDFSDCMLLSEMTIRRIKEIQKVIGECGAGIKTVTFRESNKGEGLILLEGSTGDKEEDKKLENKFRTLKKEELFSPQSCSISLFQKNTKLEGSGPQYFYEYLNDLRFRVSPRAFLQVNPRQTARLYSLVFKLGGTQWKRRCLGSLLRDRNNYFNACPKGKKSNRHRGKSRCN